MTKTKTKTKTLGGFIMQLKKIDFDFNNVTISFEYNNMLGDDLKSYFYDEFKGTGFYVDWDTVEEKLYFLEEQKNGVHIYKCLWTTTDW